MVYTMEIIRIFIAAFRLNKRIVCEESANRSLVDFHDYPEIKDDRFF